MNFPKVPDQARGHVHPEIGAVAVGELAAALSALLADHLALFVKCKGFHWHVSGPAFRSHHAMLDEHAEAALSVVDPLAERVRKLGGYTLTSIGEAARRQRISDAATPHLSTRKMFETLRDDNQQLLCYLREAHALCGEYGDIATAGLIEDWIDALEGRLWQLHEASRPASSEDE